VPKLFLTKLAIRPTRQQLVRSRIYARRVRRTSWIVAVAVLGGLAGAGFADLADWAMRTHGWIHRQAPWLSLLLLPVGFAAAAWATRRFAPEATGSGIPQVIAAAEQRWLGRWGGQRVTLRTAAWKVVLSVWLFVCGASIGREGPTVQVVAGILRSLTRGLRGGPGRRALILAGGAAGVSAAFNTPIAGVVFAVEELARSFEKRTNTTVILVVVVAGFASYAVQGDYAYFGVGSGPDTLASSWLLAPVIGITGGLLGGVFARLVAVVTGPSTHPVALWRARRPVVFAVLCGLVAAAVAAASGGLTFGAGYDEARSLLQDHPGRGLAFAVWKFIANLAAALSGAPGGIFAPSLATGAGIGAAFARAGLHIAGRDAVVLGMTSYLSGVVQAPLTSAVILMEMTREPGLVGPLMLAALSARWASSWIVKEPLYHTLSRSWRLDAKG
jgi:H+/Cl- antiporter ClcA